MIDARAALPILGLLFLGGGPLETGTATAAPDVPLPPVIGPLEYGPPAYPPAVGIPLLPPTRVGVTAVADGLSPTSRQPEPKTGVSGVNAAADTVTPIPRLGNRPPVG